MSGHHETAALGPTDQPFTLCVLGRDEVTVALQALEDKPLHGRHRCAGRDIDGYTADHHRCAVSA